MFFYLGDSSFMYDFLYTRTLRYNILILIGERDQVHTDDLTHRGRREECVIIFYDPEQTGSSLDLITRFSMR